LALTSASFDQEYFSAIKAGEKSGQLADVCEALAQHLEDKLTQKKALLQAVLYPAVLFLASMLVLVFLAFVVLPKVVSVIESSQQSLPLLTSVVLTGMHLAVDYAWLVALLIGLLWGGHRLWLRLNPGESFFEPWLLKLPVVSNYLLAFESHRFLKSMRVMIGSAVPMVEALEVSCTVLKYKRIREDFVQLTHSVQSGNLLSSELSLRSWFDSTAVQLVATGEKSGNLGEMLSKSSQWLDFQLKEQIKSMTALIQPLLLLMIGAWVLLIVTAVMLPILNMNQAFVL
jgi:general secretion pathway protein F